jgi:hypothetical protein
MGASQKRHVGNNVRNALRFSPTSFYLVRSRVAVRVTVRPAPGADAIGTSTFCPKMIADSR